MTDNTAIPDTAVITSPSAHPKIPTSPSSPATVKKALRSSAFALQTRHLTLNGVKTSIALESVFWKYYDKAERDTGVRWRVFVAQILASPQATGAKRASVLRVVACNAFIRWAGEKKRSTP